ncbi:cyclin-domain-containing protein [Lentinula raphanica]|uniref:Cyclin-domain-containing protein n=1 Tax=Lentinula raphanica TaxID=153919 RepID=A0AA38UEF9_9AGAR|nr:cyclin-domain-containing protein [Lentinula raphanica]KAJ3824204.1 cyclin-domain-containing protein [Lentinula raphanica]KAJ3835007.1 cyclin-domain-containing protein [Lentinula raphanica]KAJ3972745.1 cyclin-domain-containing protein [Lentinula raphanica]
MESTVPERVELPPAFEDVPMDDLVELIADMLERLMSHNDRIPLQPESLTRFHSRSAPGISILDYLKRIVRFTKVEKACLLITLHYIDQICARVPLFTLSSLTCHRFIIAAVTVSSKGLCDVFCNNALYAKVGGISVGELNTLEREFLRMIEWTITCTRELLQEYYINLVRTHSTSKYTIARADSSGSSSSDSSDLEMETLPSRPPSINEPSAILIDPVPPNSDISRRATIEQNMAFAALQHQNQETEP